MSDQPDRRTKKQLLDEIDGLHGTIELKDKYLKTRTEEVDDLMHQLTAKKEELYKERKAHEETKRQLKVSDSRVAAAVEAASEGALAAGLANRMISRLMDQNDLLTRDMTRLAEERPKRRP